MLGAWAGRQVDLAARWRAAVPPAELRGEKDLEAVTEMERYAWLVLADSCGSYDVARARKEDVGMGWEANGWGMYSVEAVLNARYAAAVPRGRKKEVLVRWAGGQGEQWIAWSWANMQSRVAANKILEKRVRLTPPIGAGEMSPKPANGWGNRDQRRLWRAARSGSG